MTRGVAALTGVHVGVIGILGALGHSADAFGRPTWALVALAGAFALVGSLQMHVELRRHSCAVTLVEAVLIVAIVRLNPTDIVLAATLGEVIACLRQRQPLHQLAFNAAAATAAVLAAALAFAVLPGAGIEHPLAWLSALVAAGCYGTISHASTSAVLAVVERRRLDAVFVASLVPAGVATTVSATIGLVAVVLASVTPLASLLVAPLVLLMVLETRRLADHRAEHLRFERLYAASSRTGGLQSLPVVMATLAEEARSLVTGAAGACCSLNREGAWEGVLVDDHGAHPLVGGALAAVLAAGGSGEAVELTGGDGPEALGHLVPSMESVVVARAGEDAAAPVVLAVIRHLAGDGQARGRAEVLDAFVGHAALTLANARLYADVEDALAHQVDLNRQKDDFVAVVSHELRTPLTAMIGSVATLQRMDPRLGPDRRAMLLDMALRQGLRLKRLIEELLLLATVDDRDRGELRVQETVDLRRMVDEIAADLADQRSLRPVPGIRFEAAGPAIVRSDGQKLRQIVGNLVENACKYAPGSPVLVRMVRRPTETLVEVVDRGPGIPSADRERVFERFVQLDQSSTRAQGGTGLGLYLCRTLADVLGGTLTLSEATGGGCRFVLTLPGGAAPVAPGEVDHPGPAVLASAAASAGGDDR